MRRDKINRDSLASVDGFAAGYISCALWSSTDEDGRPLDDVSYPFIHDIAPNALEGMLADCREFMADNEELLGDALVSVPHTAGHDFWLSRNGHGAGFFSREEVYGEDEARELQRRARAYAPCTLYRGEDGMIDGH